MQKTLGLINISQSSNTGIPGPEPELSLSHQKISEINLKGTRRYLVNLEFKHWGVIWVVEYN